MGILGLTHDEQGAALEKFPVTIKVAIGEAPDPDVEDSQPTRSFSFSLQEKGHAWWIGVLGAVVGNCGGVRRETDEIRRDLSPR